jgi:hypothetical protein
MTRVGKIARLPERIREQINGRLQDGGEGFIRGEKIQPSRTFSHLIRPFRTVLKDFLLWACRQKPICSSPVPKAVVRAKSGGITRSSSVANSSCLVACFASFRDSTLQNPFKTRVL